MATEFAKLAEKLKDRMVMGPEPTDCQAAFDLIAALQAWTSINCPIAKPAE